MLGNQDKDDKETAALATSAAATLSPSRRFYLLTAPRTASHLLTKILNLPSQPSLHTNPTQPPEYFFLPTIPLRLSEPSHLASRHIDTWTAEEKTALRTAYQTSYDALAAFVTDAEDKGKNILIKEHVNWLSDPVAESRFAFPSIPSSATEDNWIIEASRTTQTRSKGNETVLPDDFLLGWLPTFLIRHPALVFPSAYRTLLDIRGVDAAKAEMQSGGLALEMTLRWSRGLYDWYCSRLSPNPSSPNKTSETEEAEGVKWPIILDADDVILAPAVVRKYANLIGLDVTKLKFEWEELGKEEMEAMPNFKKRMLSTISASRGVDKSKTSVGLDIGVEAARWKEEFGEDEGVEIERWVRDAMPDYEYLRVKRLRAQGM